MRHCGLSLGLAAHAGGRRAFTKLSSMQLEYEEAECRTNSTEVSPPFSSFFLSFFRNVRMFAKKSVRNSAFSHNVICFIFFLNTKYDKAADIRLASTL